MKFATDTDGSKLEVIRLWGQSWNDDLEAICDTSDDLLRRHDDSEVIMVSGETKQAKQTTTTVTAERELTEEEINQFTGYQREYLVQLVASGDTVEVALKKAESVRRRLTEGDDGVVYENTVTIVGNNLDALPSTEEIAKSATATAEEAPGLPEMDVDEESATTKEVTVEVETDSDGNITIVGDALPKDVEESLEEESVDPAPKQKGESCGPCFSISGNCGKCRPKA
eukprot:TRINITY_DN300_c0_g1_i2.p1 TRINITY_DN300_c0_g1~~TRINITY_DN300_c0_g1_i2.p1  ORF type:complete len:227 (-),score=33.84 TRINITY_DN300_c0_g1_i2:81-761(-)